MDIEHPSKPCRPCRSLLGVRIISTGSYVPDTIVTNAHLHKRLGCDSKWIIKRTGILERRYAAPYQATSDLCQEAGRRCIVKAGVNPKDIDLLILATCTPDMTFPSAACLVQDRLKLTCAALELQSACAGFMFALVTGAAYILSGASDLALIIGGDCNTRIADPKDIKTWPLFGDAAGAVILTRGAADQGLVSYCLGSDGGGADILNRPACGSRMPPTPELLAQGMHYLHMDGRAVFRWAVAILCDTIGEVLKSSGLRPDDVDLYFPHQANMRIINTAADVLKIPRHKVCRNLERYGNTSAASIPLGIDEAFTAGQIEPGSLLVLSGLGAGLTWGTAVWRW